MEPEVGWTLHARSWTERGLGGGWVAAELPPLRTGIESLPLSLSLRWLLSCCRCGRERAGKTGSSHGDGDGRYGGGAGGELRVPSLLVKMTGRKEG